MLSHHDHQLEKIGHWCTYIAVDLARVFGRDCLDSELFKRLVQSRNKKGVMFIWGIG